MIFGTVTHLRPEVELERLVVAFDEIEFGYKSAEAERRNKPELLMEGFFDNSGLIDDLRDSAYYLVLGYKGSGKSSIAEHLSLLSDTDSLLFVDSILLRDFPFDEVPQVVEGESSLAVRTNLAWSLLLLLKIFESLSKDQGAVQEDTRILDIARELRVLNLLPKRKFRDLVLSSREVNLAVELPKIFSASMKQGYSEPVLILSHVRDALRDVILNVSTESQHILVIDGLDEVFAKFTDTYQILASLVHEVDALNAEFDATSACAKIILLCRTDLFERLPSPNINKLRDYAITLDWYHNPQRPFKSDLFAVATHRARLAGYKGTDVLSDYLPSQLSRSSNGKTETFKYLLDHTRHTPRDFLQLLHHVQEEVHGASRVARDDVIDGLREYSIAYFLPELKDEMAGYFEPEEVEHCFRLIGGLRRREFWLQDLESYAAEARLDSDINLMEALRVLFDCSAIGNIVFRPWRSAGQAGSDGPKGGRVRGGTYYTFRYRNRNASINYSEQFVLHRGVWKALNLT